MSAILNIATKAAYLASSALQQLNRNLLNTKKEKKLTEANVNEIKKLSYEIIYDYIHKARPDHRVISADEYMDISIEQPTWVIEPINGLSNFIHGNPNYAISIAFANKGKLSDGIILDINRNDLYRASDGRGAMLNDTRVRINQHTSNLADAIIAIDPSLNEVSFNNNLISLLIEHSGGLRISGSNYLDLAFVTNGQLNAYIGNNYEQFIVSAPAIILREAGVDINYTNKKIPGLANLFIASNSKLQQHLINLITAKI